MACPKCGAEEGRYVVQYHRGCGVWRDITIGGIEAWWHTLAEAEHDINTRTNPQDFRIIRRTTEVRP